MRIKARSIDLRVNVGPTQKEREERIIKERERRREAGHINRMKKLQEESAGSVHSDDAETRSQKSMSMQGDETNEAYESMYAASWT